jgi:hypothetical protein
MTTYSGKGIEGGMDREECVQLSKGVKSFVDAAHTLEKIADQLEEVVSSIQKERIWSNYERRSFEEFN